MRRGRAIDSTVRTSTGTFFGREVRALDGQILCVKGCWKALHIVDWIVLRSSGPFAGLLRGAVCCVMCGADRAPGPRVLFWLGSMIVLWVWQKGYGFSLGGFLS